MQEKVNGNSIDFKKGVTYPVTEDVTFSQGRMLLFQSLVAHLPYNPNESQKLAIEQRDPKHSRGSQGSSSRVQPFLVTISPKQNVSVTRYLY